MPHHPKTNACLERHHREVHKYMIIYLNNIKNSTNLDIETSLEEYIFYHNNKKNIVLN